jgi:SAM-dependent methyltransferase
VKDMKKDYHNYTVKDGKLIGDFEGAYKNEKKYGYDSWGQSDSRHLYNEISLAILNRYNFDVVLDIGCGKGLFTSKLKKHNNHVHGWDISKTAIDVATYTFKDIIFDCKDITKEKIPYFCDLIVMREMIYFVYNWEEVLRKVSETTRYCYVTLYIPENTVYHIPNLDIFKEKYKELFSVEYEVYVPKFNQWCVLGKTKKHR